MTPAPDSVSTQASAALRMATLALVACAGLAIAQEAPPPADPPADPVEAALSAASSPAAPERDDNEREDNASDDLLAGPNVGAEVIPGAPQTFGAEADPLMRGARVPLRTYLEAVRELSLPETPEALRVERGMMQDLMGRVRLHYREVGEYWASMRDQVAAIRRQAGLGEPMRRADQRAAGGPQGQQRVRQEIEQLMRELRGETDRRPAPSDTAPAEPAPSDQMTDAMMSGEAMTGQAMTGSMTEGERAEPAPEARPREVSPAQRAALEQLAEIRRNAPSDVALRADIWERLSEPQRERVVESINERYRRDYERRTGIRMMGEGDDLLDDVDGPMTREGVMRGDYDEIIFREDTKARLARLNGRVQEVATQRARERAVRALFGNTDASEHRSPAPPSIEDVLGRRPSGR